MSADESTPSSMDSELEARLAAAREARARSAEDRHKREQARSLSEQVEREERAARNEQAIADAEVEHGPVGRFILPVEARNGVVIVKRPHPALYRRFQDAGKQTVEECEKLVKPCLVYPDVATFDRWCDEEPALTLRVADHVVTLAGFRRDEISGK